MWHGSLAVTGGSTCVRSARLTGGLLDRAAHLGLFCVVALRAVPSDAMAGRCWRESRPLRAAGARTHVPREACWLSGRLWAAGWLRDCAAAASGLAVRMPANSPRWRLGRPRTGDVLTGKWLWIGKVGRFHACAASPHGTPGLTPHEDRAWNRAPLTGGCAPCAVPRAVLPRGRATAHARCRARRARSQQRGQPGPGTRPGERCGAPATDQSQPYHAV